MHSLDDQNWANIHYVHQYASMSKSTFNSTNTSRTIMFAVWTLYSFMRVWEQNFNGSLIGSWLTGPRRGCWSQTHATPRHGPTRHHLAEPACVCPNQPPRPAASHPTPPRCPLRGEPAASAGEGRGAMVGGAGRCGSSTAPRSRLQTRHAMSCRAVSGPAQPADGALGREAHPAGGWRGSPRLEARLSPPQIWVCAEAQQAPPK